MARWRQIELRVEEAFEMDASPRGPEGGFALLKVQFLIPILAFLIVATAPVVMRGSTCSATYCVSIRENVSAGAGLATMEPVWALLSIEQALLVAVAASPLATVIASQRRGFPVPLLRTVRHVRGLAAVRPHSRNLSPGAFWLPIESISAGRLTSRMLKASNFFGLGRLPA